MLPTVLKLISFSGFIICLLSCLSFRLSGFSYLLLFVSYFGVSVSMPILRGWLSSPAFSMVSVWYVMGEVDQDCFSYYKLP